MQVLPIPVLPEELTSSIQQAGCQEQFVPPWATRGHAASEWTNDLISLGQMNALVRDTAGRRPAMQPFLSERANRAAIPLHRFRCHPQMEQTYPNFRAPHRASEAQSALYGHFPSPSSAGLAQAQQLLQPSWAMSQPAESTYIP